MSIGRIACLFVLLGACAESSPDTIELPVGDDKADGSRYTQLVFTDRDSVTQVAQCDEWRSCDIRYQLWAEDDDVLAHARAFFRASPEATTYEVRLATVDVTIDGAPYGSFVFRARAGKDGDEVVVLGLESETYWDNGRERIRISDERRDARVVFRVTPTAEALAAGWDPLVLTSMAQWW